MAAQPQQRVPLRGLMFSLPENNRRYTERNGAERKYILNHSHALALPVTWQGIVDDCTRVRGRRVGMAWDRRLPGH
jgi:type VI secretion system protein ImpL